MESLGEIFWLWAKSWQSLNCNCRAESPPYSNAKQGKVLVYRIYSTCRQVLLSQTWAKRLWPTRRTGLIIWYLYSYTLFTMQSFEGFSINVLAPKPAEPYRCPQHDEIPDLYPNAKPYHLIFAHEGRDMIWTSWPSKSDFPTRRSHPHPHCPRPSFAIPIL